MKKKVFGILCLFLASVWAAQAKKETVRGSVSDGKKPVPNLIIEASGNKTAETNKKGAFKIKGVSLEEDTIFMKITPDKVLEIPLKGANQITVSLEDDTIFVQLEKPEEYQVTYGGTIITRKMLEQTGETNLLRAIAMRAPGVEYTNGSLLIRGIKSFNLSNDPLFILDGVETTNVSYLTVMEVETVEVIKDAATSMFGVRGGNGVVVIRLRK